MSMLNRKHKENEILHEEWMVKKIGDVLKIASGRDYKHLKEGNIPVYGSGGLMSFVDDFLYEGESVGIGRKGTINKPQLLSGRFWTVDTLFYTHSFECVYPRYIYYIFSSIDWYKYNEASGVPSLSKNTINNIPIVIPPLAEQSEIVRILSIWDKALEINTNFLNKIKSRKEYLGVKLFSNIQQNKAIKLYPLSALVDKIKLAFKPIAEEYYREIGIKSHAKGIFHKVPVTGKSLGNKSVFWIEPECFVVNIVFAWEQAIAKTTEAEVGMIASHRFPMYKPKEGVLDLDYLLYFFKSAKGKNLLELASPGGAGRNKTLGQSEFSKLKIPVPPIEEQKKIVQLLNAADKEIELQKQKIEVIKLQKIGLMQQLLTGKKRLKINHDKLKI